jgi:hypothetical protein
MKIKIKKQDILSAAKELALPPPHQIIERRAEGGVLYYWLYVGGSDNRRFAEIIPSDEVSELKRAIMCLREDGP